LRKSDRDQRSCVSAIDPVVAVRYGQKMHLQRKSLLVFLFVAVTGCAGSTPGAKTSDGGATGSDNGAAGGKASDGGAADGKQAECSGVEEQFKQLDEAAKSAKGSKGTGVGRVLAPAVDKLAKHFKDSPPKTPGLDKAIAELVTEAESFSGKLKAMDVAFAEMEEVNTTLKTWQGNVEKSADAFDTACAKAPKDECESMSKRVARIPQLDGDEFGKYANDLERFVTTMDMYEVTNTGLRKALKDMLAVLKDGVKPMRRLDQLLEEPKKLDPAVGQMKAKMNQVREICGLPVRQ
jgi:hypothetical protein